MRGAGVAILFSAFTQKIGQRVFVRPIVLHGLLDRLGRIESFLLPQKGAGNRPIENAWGFGCEF